MTDRPIIFSAPMVLALMNGKKTQTRRLLKAVVPAAPAMDNVRHVPRHQAPYLDAYCSEPKTPENQRGMSHLWAWWTRDDRPGAVFNARYKPGDRLYVRENFTLIPSSAYRCSEGVQYTIDPTDRDMAAIYAAGWERSIPKWKPCIHMPRWASRLLLTVVDVRVQRLQDISEEDAVAEGLAALTKDGKLFKYGIPDTDGLPGTDNHGWPWHRWQRNPVLAYSSLWNQINGPGAWETNPWIVAVTFTVEQRNIDQEKK